jgi:hypothetical protein
MSSGHIARKLEVRQKNAEVLVEEKVFNERKENEG